VSLDKKTRVWMIIGLVLLAFVTITPEEVDKKTSTGEWGRAGIGVIALALAVVMALALPGAGYAPAAALVTIGLFLIGGGGLFSGVAGLLTPDKGIPGWAWIAGFGLLAFMIFKKSKS